MKAYAVIGANFGDEGKGLCTDFLADNLIRQGKKTLVIRFNGGAQAGHTVVTPEGKRHVFHHIGSGTFAGADTYLADKFIVNPIVFAQEKHDLGEIKTKIYVNGNCLLTTPFDMIVNQCVEMSRGDGRHGSCGLGIHQTVERSKSIPINTFDWYSAPGPYLIRRLSDIRQLSIEEPSINHDDARCRQLIDLMMNEELISRFLYDVSTFCRSSSILPFAPALEFINEIYDAIIFEGAQGLMLDAEHKFFPHVTCSRTGLTNVAEMLQKMPQINELEIIYVTRAYMTRHGAGPLPGETDAIPGITVKDETNTENRFQGKLRIAPLDIPEIVGAIKKDIADANITIPYSVGILTTHMDCVNSLHRRMKEAISMARDLENSIPSCRVFNMFSFGRTRKDIPPMEML